MNSSGMLFTVGFVLLCFGGCSDSSNTAGSKESGNPFDEFDEVFPDEPVLLSLKRQAKAGDATAQYELGTRYSEGKGVSKDPAQAVAWWSKAAGQGNIIAQRRLGVSYINAKESVAGLVWLEKAAEQGDVQAQFLLGQLYDDRPIYDMSKVDEGIAAAEVATWYRKAAELGLVNVRQTLEGIPKDSDKAATWYRKAAEAGDAYAQFNLGQMYSSGRGVPKDKWQAVAWYRKAAVQGDAEAQYQLGWQYFFGNGVPKDYTQGAAWFRNAAEQGLAKAQLQLGLEYAAGKRLPRDATQAYMWANLAASQGKDEFFRKLAVVTREDLATRMSPEQIAEAQRLAREWKPSQHTESTAISNGTPGSAMQKAITGTAFVVSKQGHLLTNRHVVGNCQLVRLAGSDKPLKVLPQDEANDLALLQMTDKPKALAVFRASNDLRQGESIAAYGYPLQGTLAAGGNLSPGAVSALAGLGNNASQIQITAPIQPGNSGGPVLDDKGQVVGVVVQKLNAVKVAQLTGDVPQNVNFAINESTTRAFLDSNQVDYKTGHWWNFFKKDLTDIAEEARSYTVVVECWR